jgi:uncharacterized protein (UPF0261 family)
MSDTILCIGTLDTKGEELAYIKEQIEKRNYSVKVIDPGILGDPLFSADITREEVALAADSSLEEVRKSRTAQEARAIMKQGLLKIVRDLHNSGEFAGVMGIGGSQGSDMGSAVMRELPIGFPKVLISSNVAFIGGKSYVGGKDIVLIPSVVDIAGLNRVTKQIFSNAAGAIVGMVESGKVADSDKPVVVMSMMGPTTACGGKVKETLERKGYEVIVFASIGPGGNALEGFVKTEDVKGIIELGTNEVGAEIHGTFASAGPHRLETAGERGIPQLITFGCVDVVIFGSEPLPPEFKDHRVYRHIPEIQVVRQEPDNLKQIAQVMAEKLNKSKGPTMVLLPTRGFSELSRENKIFPHPEADIAFIKALEETLNEEIHVKKIDTHINDDLFAEEVLKEFLGMIE